MCGFQIELRRIRQELKDAIERNEEIYTHAKQRGNDRSYEMYCQGYGVALKRALRLIDEPAEHEETN